MVNTGQKETFLGGIAPPKISNADGDHKKNPRKTVINTRLSILLPNGGDTKKEATIKKKQEQQR